MTTHELLVEARNLIDREGAVRGRYCGGCGYCAIGALIAASGGRTPECRLGPSGGLGDWCTTNLPGSLREQFLLAHPETFEAYRLLDECVPEPPSKLGFGGSVVESWWEFSDPDQVTGADLLAVFDKAINASSPPPPDLQLSELVEAAECVTA